MESVITVRFEIQICGVPTMISARVDVTGPDFLVLESWFTQNGSPLVCLPDAAKAAVLRHAVTEAKDREREPMTEFVGAGHAIFG